MGEIYCILENERISECWLKRGAHKVRECDGCADRQKIETGKIYCRVEGQRISKCWLEQGHPKFPDCDKCDYYRKIEKRKENIRRVEERKRQCDKEIEDAKRIIKEADEKGITRLPLNPFPELKRLRSKTPKECFVKDSCTGEQRRLRFDKDYWKRNRFEHSLCLMCARCGKQIALRMSIRQINEEPEMKWMKRSRRLETRTLAKWRRNLCKICPKEEPNKKIYVGRPKSQRPPKAH